MLVKDIDPAGSGAFSGPTVLADVAGTLFFTVSNGTHGREVWRSDGSAAGTVLVKDVNPGSAGSDPHLLTDVGGTLFFRATDGTHGYEGWRSDGTEPGTVLVKDLNPGASGSRPGFLTNVRGTLFFTADDGTRGVALWGSDGSEAGTGLVGDVDPGTLDNGPRELADIGGTLFFSANDGRHGRELELWKVQAPAPADSTSPAITLTTPPEGAVYTLNQLVTADYSCQDEAGGSGLASCLGTVANGVAIDTGSVGAKTFTVTAMDNAGNKSSVTHHYSVGYGFSGFSRR